MNIEQLSAYLAAQKVPEDEYSLTGGLPSEAHCLEPLEQGFRVYYSERGCRTGETFYATEEEACQGLLALMRRCPTLCGRLDG